VLVLLLLVVAFGIRRLLVTNATEAGDRETNDAGA
jgi:hypothetical protein